LFEEKRGFQRKKRTFAKVPNVPRKKNSKDRGPGTDRSKKEVCGGRGGRLINCFGCLGGAPETERKFFGMAKGNGHHGGS